MHVVEDEQRWCEMIERKTEIIWCSCLRFAEVLKILMERYDGLQSCCLIFKEMKIEGSLVWLGSYFVLSVFKVSVKRRKWFVILVKQRGICVCGLVDEYKDKWALQKLKLSDVAN